MKKFLDKFINTIFIIEIVLFYTLFMCGCGHNAVIASKGWGIDISWTGESYIPNFRLGYWDSTSAVVKENVDIEIASSAGLNASANSSSVSNSGATAGGNAGTTIKMKTGPQTNGYVKEVLTAQNINNNNVEMAKALYAVRSTMESKGVLSSSTPINTTSTANTDISKNITTQSVTSITPINNIGTPVKEQTVTPTKTETVKTTKAVETKLETPKKKVGDYKRVLYGVIALIIVIIGAIAIVRIFKKPEEQENYTDTPNLDSISKDSPTTKVDQQK